MNYSRAERVTLAKIIAEGRDPDCPACGTRLARREVNPRSEVPYVRRRVWLICPECRRTAVVD